MNDREMIENTLTNIAQYKVDKISTHVYMFNYRWYGKKPPRKYYEELFNNILNIIKIKEED